MTPAMQIGVFKSETTKHHITVLEECKDTEREHYMCSQTCSTYKKHSIITEVFDHRSNMANTPIGYEHTKDNNEKEEQKLKHLQNNHEMILTIYHLNVYHNVMANMAVGFIIKSSLRLKNYVRGTIKKLNHYQR